jgi:N6-L-threonylcarbamoyladenine synthase
VGNPSRLAEVARAPVARPSDGAAQGHVAQLAAEFQQAVVDVLVGKTCQAATDFGVSQIALAGGVAANRRLREAMVEQSPVPVLVPDVDLCTDNAAMVAAAGYYRLGAGDIAGPDLDVVPSLRLA